MQADPAAPDNARPADETVDPSAADPSHRAGCLQSDRAAATGNRESRHRLPRAASDAAATTPALAPVPRENIRTIASRHRRPATPAASLHPSRSSKRPAFSGAPPARALALTDSLGLLHLP